MNDQISTDSWLYRIGTISFESSFMMQQIFFGNLDVDKNGNFYRNESNKSNFCIELWISFVPEVFQSEVVCVAKDLFKEIKFHNAETQSILTFIYLFQRKALQDYSEGKLTRSGWLL